MKSRLLPLMLSLTLLMGMATLSPVAAATAEAQEPAGITAGGTIGLANGSAAADVKVNLFTEGRDEFLGVEFTDAAGRYSFVVPGPGCYVITFVAPDGRVFVDTGRRFKNTTFCAGSGDQVTSLDATLTNGGRSDLGGTVTDEAPSPVAGARAVVYTDNGGQRGRWLGRATTGADGTWRFEAANGCYVVDLVAPTGRTWAANDGRFLQRRGCVSQGDNLNLGGVLNGGSASIALSRSETVEYAGFTWRLDFYRNRTHRCGLSGNYTFLVVNPAGDTDGSAPLWVYLHGGGAGYFDEDGEYWASIGQDENGWNREEGFGSLWDHQIRRVILDGNDNPIDQTLKRRIEEGYRILVVAMCDHDLYGGNGTPYPNNPVGGQVNGLQATKAAVNHVTANYPSPQVYAHGISAGSVGAFALSQAMAADGDPLDGVIADSYIMTPRMFHLFSRRAGVGDFPFPAGYDPAQVIAKAGPAVDPGMAADPTSRIRAGFDDTPILFIATEFDRYCGGTTAPVPRAREAGMWNCEWFYDGLRQAIDAQPSSPHRLVFLRNDYHVPTDRPGPANDIVDEFIQSISG